MATDMSDTTNVTEQAKRLHFAETLLHVSRTVSAMETLDDVLAALIEMAVLETDSDRGTLFLNDPATGELYSRVLQGEQTLEIRLLNDVGIAGRVFTTHESLIINGAYADPRFNREVDELTGYETRNLVCAPITTARGVVIGVAQVLNKREGDYDVDDLALLEAMTSQASAALVSASHLEDVDMRRSEEMEFLRLVSDITAELDLDALLQRVMAEATRMLRAERSTLFLLDERSGELFARVAEGDSVGEIRFPATEGIAGTVFSSGESINIAHAYADLRFNPELDRRTGFFTRSILCVPVISNDGHIIGVTQVLNRRGGRFTQEDEQRLKAFTAQVSIALQNAKLFDDVQNMRNYSEAMLASMSNGVITLDMEGAVATCNDAGGRILGTGASSLVGSHYSEVFGSAEEIIGAMVARVADDVIRTPEMAMDVDIQRLATEGRGATSAVVSANVSVLPLIGGIGEHLGTMVVMEDISGEKRVRSTMARYMDPALADQLVRGDEDILGGRSVEASVLFSDVRNFTSLAEELGPQATVTLLNDYFTIMVECIQEQGGMLDKFIGDAIMAAFGLPVAHGDDADRAVQSAISMISSLFEWNEERMQDGRRPIDMGIGINTGTVVAGNIGSPKRMDFTMIGDGVNLAARLESACKQYSARILISEYTLEELNGVYRTREVDHVVVKGKTQPVAVYEVLDYHTPQTFPNLMDAVNHFRDGIEKYRSGNWEGAVNAFRETLRANPDDTLAETYIDRCLVLKENPPADWNGIWVMTSK
ncbi:MAG: GAF domain-containing protein [Acidimicrobiales bacterium]